jgi:hypothetical protein
MSHWPQSMNALAERVSLVPANRTVDEVVEKLTAIERDLDGFFSPDGGGPAARRDRPPLPDGVACFNGMYLRVTEAVRDELPNFESPAFVERLDVLFAEFYFQAYDAALEGEWISQAWAPLFARRQEKRLALQFAITGMNAHINNDLAHALVLTWKELGDVPARDTPEARDYERVNAILERVETEIKVPLSDELIATVDTAFGTTDDFLALWSIRRARAQAWERARIMRTVTGDELAGVFDGIVGFAGNLLLGPAR